MGQTCLVSLSSLPTADGCAPNSVGSTAQVGLTQALRPMPFSHASPYTKLTDEQHQLIGMFVSEWATAEYFLSELLGRLLLAPEFLCRTYTDSLGAAQMQDAICQAVEIHKYRYNFQLIDQENLQEILSLNKKIEKLRSLRNKFAHFCWMRTTDETIFGTSLSGAVPSDKRHKRAHASLQVTEIREQYEELYAVVQRLQDITYGLPEIPEESVISIFTRLQDGS